MSTSTGSCAMKAATNAITSSADDSVGRPARSTASSGKPSCPYAPCSCGISSAISRRVSFGRVSRQDLPVRLSQLVEASEAVARTGSRLEKVARLAALLKSAEPAELPVIVSFLSGSPLQGRIGIGGATLAALSDVPASPDPPLSVVDIDATFDAVKSTAGAGSAARRAGLLRTLFSRATRAEQQF